MEIDLLSKFEENINNIYFTSKSKSFFSENIIDIQRAILILKSFFGEAYFKVNQGFSNKDISSLYANDQWIIYHLAQSKNSIGSIQVILEIAEIIRYFSQTEKNKLLLNLKLKPNGKINESQIRCSLFELYAAKILNSSGFNIAIDEIDFSVSKDKRLDIVAEHEDEKYLIECMTLNEHEEEKVMINLSSYFINTYTFLIDKYKNDFQVLGALPVCGYFVVENKKALNNAKTRFKEQLRKYQKDIISMKYGGKTISVPYSEKEDFKFEICIEPFKLGLFEAYNGFFDKKFFALRFRLIPRRVGSNFELSPQLDMSIQFPKEELEERIKTAIENKRSQHHNSIIKNKIFMLEYENYQGIRISLDTMQISKERLRGNINKNQIAFIIHKDSSKNEAISRKRILISKDEDCSIFNKLKCIPLTLLAEKAS
jgi:hypothetical protein